MINERKTEILTREHLAKLHYYDPDAFVIIEEQASDNPIIRECLKKASKSGGTGCGKPEYIIQFPNTD